MQTSPAQSLNSVDWGKIGLHFVYACLGSGIAYLLTTVIPSLNLSGTVAVFIPVITAVLVALKSYFTDYTATN